jgi:eukaryotic-like serine/threonine-protein kinase
MRPPQILLKEIFGEALEKESLQERDAFLNAACSANSELRKQVDLLLAAHAQCIDSSDFLQQSIISPAAINLRPGSIIGRYKIIEHIGEGGFGSVFMAEQQQPVRRMVALKVIKAGMDTRQVIARFEAERQALAMMDHPNIARVLDGGETENGRPYFVMELVHGKKITDYCNENNLPIRERLELFIQICHAIQHAHQKGIVHRDLKPSNILVFSDPNLNPSVTPSAIPKIIDFGIAKATQGRLTEESIQTAFHQFIGTPAYMSPEQADLSPDIDTRTDIYSLGILLYELLGGRPPFDNHRLITAGFDEMRRTILEIEPVPPSQAAPRATALLVPCDLDWIVMKCLEKDRSRRYQTANALAADIQRHLSQLPITARPPSAADLIGKFLLRHRAFSLAAAFAIFIVIISGIFITLALLRENAARRAAELRLNAALGIVDAIADKALPELEASVGGAKALEVLATSGLEYVEQLRATSVNDPRLALAVAKVLIRLSRVQGSAIVNHRGDFEAALASAQRAAALLESSAPEYNSTLRLSLLWQAYFRLAMSLDNLGRPRDGVYDTHSENQSFSCRIGEIP